MTKKRLIVKVPKLLNDRGMDEKDLMWGAKLTINTAKRWADPIEANLIDRIDKDTIENIASFLDVPIEDLLEIVDEIE